MTTVARAAGGASADAYIVSLLKAWWGDGRDAENDFCFSYLPRIDDDNSHYWTVEQMLAGEGRRATSSPARTPPSARRTGGRSGSALAKLDWLVVRDLVEIETRGVLVRQPRDRVRRARARRRSGPRSSSCRPRRTSRRTARSRTRSGCCSGTTRRSSRRSDCRSELWFYYHLGRKIRERLAGLERPERDRAAPRPDLGLPDERRRSRSRAPRRCSRRSTAGTTRASRSPRYKQLKADGSTACGCWIYCGVFADGDQPGRAAQAALGAGVHARSSGPGRGPRTGACSTTAPRPIPTASRGRSARSYVWWDAAAGEVDGRRHAGLRRAEAARLRARRTARRGPDAIRGDAPVHHAGRRARLALRAAGARRRAAADALRAARVAVRRTRSTSSARTRRGSRHELARTRTTRRRRAGLRRSIPFVVTTYRLTEHHTAGGMSRFVPYLAELQPRDVRRGAPRARARARARARRLGDDRRRRARRSRRACW